jgi:hypothetical protein
LASHRGTLRNAPVRSRHICRIEVNAAGRGERFERALPAQAFELGEIMLGLRAVPPGAYHIDLIGRTRDKRSPPFTAPADGTYLWQTLSKAMQELPHGLLLPGVHRGCSPLRQDDINVCRAYPVIPDACALRSFIRCC